MNVIVSTRLLGAIMVASLASAASGMDLSQQPAPGADETPALRLPAFLDISRLPDMQDAWRLHSGGEFTPTLTPAAATTPEPAEDEGALETARAALTRAEQVSREAAVVRERAEELSRRFGAEPASAAPAAAEPEAASATAAPEAAAPTETASIEPSAAPPEAPLPPPAHVLTPDDAAAVASQNEASQTEASQNEAAQGEASQTEPVDVPAKKPAAKKKTVAVDGAPVIEEMATNKPAKTAKRLSNGATARQITQVTNTKPSTPGLMVFEDSPTQPEHDPSKMLPTELRSFGWNDQP